MTQQRDGSCSCLFETGNVWSSSATILHVLAAFLLWHNWFKETNDWWVEQGHAGWWPLSCEHQDWTPLVETVALAEFDEFRWSDGSWSSSDFRCVISSSVPHIKTAETSLLVWTFQNLYSGSAVLWRGFVYWYPLFCFVLLCSLWHQSFTIVSLLS